MILESKLRALVAEWREFSESTISFGHAEFGRERRTIEAAWRDRAKDCADELEALLEREEPANYLRDCPDCEQEQMVPAPSSTDFHTWWDRKGNEIAQNNGKCFTARMAWRDALLAAAKPAHDGEEWDRGFKAGRTAGESEWSIAIADFGEEVLRVVKARAASQEDEEMSQQDSEKNMRLHEMVESLISDRCDAWLGPYQCELDCKHSGSHKFDSQKTRKESVILHRCPHGAIVKLLEPLEVDEEPQFIVTKRTGQRQPLPKEAK